MRFSSLVRCALVALPLASAACADFDWFDEKKTPLAGDRRAVFPTGVPGVNYNTPPMQPTNSNIPIDTQISNTALGRQEPATQEKEQPGAKSKSRTARNAPRNQPAQPAQPAAEPADDPWSDSRSNN